MRRHHPARARLVNFLMVILVTGVWGCAPSQVSTAPSTPPPPRTPVQVFAPPAKVPLTETDRLRPAEEEVLQDERGIENYSARLKKIPKQKRAKPKGEKVYPIDLNLRNADLVEAIRVLADATWAAQYPGAGGPEAAKKLLQELMDACRSPSVFLALCQELVREDEGAPGGAGRGAEAGQARSQKEH